jgi:hypothetical protein
MDTSVAKHRGVSFDKRRNKYIVSIKIDGKNKFLGYFELQDFDKAVKTRIEAEELYTKDKNILKKKNRNEFIKNIISDYQSGMSLEKVGQKYNRNPSTIFEILANNNIQRRNNTKPCDIALLTKMYENNKSSYFLEKDFNLSASTILNKLKKANVEIKKRKHLLDECLFDNIDNEWKSYFLGLMFADGNVRKPECGWRASISLQEEDKYILDKISIFIYEGDKLKYTKPKTFKRNDGKISKHSGMYTLGINSKKIVNKLIEHGCFPKKSLTLDWPTNVPDNLLNHFIRGYFDGDGGVSSKVISFISSDLFCQKLKKILDEKLHINIKLRKRPCEKISRLYLHKMKENEILYNYLYENATLFLERKRSKFFESFKSKN